MDKKSKKELSTQSHAYHDIVDTIPTPIFQVSETLVIMLANREAHRKWPWIVEGKSLFCDLLLHGEERDSYGDCIIKNTFKSKKSLSAEIGSEKGGVFLVKTAFVEDGQCGKVIVHILDVTGLKKIETALEKSEKKYRTIFEFSPETIVLLDKDGKLADINERLSDRIGYKRENIIGKHFLEIPFLPRESKAKAKEMFSRRMLGNDIPPYEIDLITGTGERIIGRIISTPVKDADGQIINTLIIVSDITGQKKAEEELKRHRDHLEESVKKRTAELTKVNEGLEAEITERKKTEKALGQSEERWHSLVKNAPDIITMADKKGTILFINRTVSGIPVEQITGKNIYDFVTPEDRGRLKNCIARVMQTGEAEKLELTAVSSPGITSWYEDHIGPVMQDGRIVAVIIVTSDISERKKAEERIRASLEEKEILLREIHHRVKNNLQTISSLLRLQAGYIEDKKALEVLKNSGERIHSMALVHEELYRSRDLSKISFAGYLHNLVAHLFDSHYLKPGQVRKEIQIENVVLDIETSIPLGLIISELISNSLKHAFPDFREGKIRVEMVKCENEEYDYTLMVRDNGAGFPPDVDYRESRTLGMVLVLTLVKQLHGTIDLDREKGTTFTIQFKKLKYKKRI